MAGTIGVGRATTIETETVKDLGGPSSATAGNAQDFDKLVNDGGSEKGTSGAPEALSKVQDASSSDGLTSMSKVESVSAASAGSLTAPATENLDASGAQGSSSQSSPGDKILNSLADSANKVSS